MTIAPPKIEWRPSRNGNPAMFGGWWAGAKVAAFAYRSDGRFLVRVYLVSGNEETQTTTHSSAASAKAWAEERVAAWYQAALPALREALINRAA